jgi:hypothetical protein
MDDQQVGAPRGGLLGHLGSGVDGQQHLRDLVGGRVAGDQADRVPRLGGLGWVPLVDQVDDLGQARHGREATGTRPPRIRGMELRLVEVTPDNWRPVADLAPRDDQRRVVELLLERLVPSAGPVRMSCHPDNLASQALFGSLGFADTGEWEDDEQVWELVS